jgi:hypothetical protein
MDPPSSRHPLKYAPAYRTAQTDCGLEYIYSDLNQELP